MDKVKRLQQAIARYGFPMGWIAARIAEGNYKLAVVDIIVVLALLGALSLVDYLEGRWPTTPSSK